MGNHWTVLESWGNRCLDREEKERERKELIMDSVVRAISVKSYDKLLNRTDEKGKGDPIGKERKERSRFWLLV